jgi:hypothetical protein
MCQCLCVYATPRVFSIHALYTGVSADCQRYGLQGHTALYSLDFARCVGAAFGDPESNLGYLWL